MIRLVVEDEGACYPVTIDPLVWGEQARLTASDGAEGDKFGASVAIWGDTAVVGAPYDHVGGRGDQGLYVPHS